MEILGDYVKDSALWTHSSSWTAGTNPCETSDLQQICEVKGVGWIYRETQTTLRM